MIYCDTSLLISALTPEVHSDVARTWLLPQDRKSLVVSDWNLTEFASAIALKHRRGHIDDDHRTWAEHVWDELRREFTFVMTASYHFQQAADLVDSAPRALRAGDALHLAIALDQNCDLATFDHDLADAARVRGLVVHPD